MGKERFGSVKNKGLGDFVRRGRESRGLSLKDAAAASELDPSYWGKLEAGRYAMPSPLALERVAEVIACGVEDLYALAGYEPSGGLPSFRPYLRARYHLPPEAIDQLEGYFRFLRHQYDIPADQPLFPPKDRGDDARSAA